MQRTASYPAVPEQPRTLAIAGSLLLVSLSYVLLLAAPVISRHFGAFALGQGGLKTLESWLPLACGAGLVLGGASALVFVLTQITREAQRRPYISLAPVLAAFSACVLIGLRAQLPLPGVSSEHVAVFALAVAVVGGSLVQTSRVSSQLLGMACTFLPPASLFGVLWILSGSADPARVVWSLPATTRAYLGVLTLSSFLIGAVATLGRRADAAPAEGPMLTARLPAATPPLYGGYDFEQSYDADEAALRRRGLPAWIIAVTAAAALLLSFLAVKTYMERRAALSFLERDTSARVQPTSAALAPATSSLTIGEPTVQASKPAELAPSSVERPAEAAAPAAAIAPSRAETTATAAPEEAKRALEASPSAAPAQPLHEKSSAVPEAHHVHRSSSRARTHASAKVASARKQPEARAESKRSEVKPTIAAPVPAKPAPKEDTVSVALKAARAATQDDAKPAAAKSEPKAAPATRGDESLDELMDNVMKPAKGASKKHVTDDPIFGL